MLLTLATFLADEEGGALAEYGIIAAALAIPMMAALGTVTAVTGATLQTTGNGLTAVGTNP
ncbi:MAG: hypothetical protein NVS9B12_08780 [Vulcanimicrobiaceae bacterium]